MERTDSPIDNKSKPEDVAIEGNLRPKRLDSYFGQKLVKDIEATVYKYNSILLYVLQIKEMIHLTIYCFMVLLALERQH